MKKLKTCSILSSIVFILNLILVICLFIINIFPANLIYYRSLFMCSFILFAILLVIYLVMILGKIKLKNKEDKKLEKKKYNISLIISSIEIMTIYAMFIIYLVKY